MSHRRRHDGEIQGWMRLSLGDGGPPGSWGPRDFPRIVLALTAVAPALLGLGTFIWGRVIDRLGARRTLLVGLLGSAMAALAMLPFLTSLWVYVILFWITTVGGACGNPGSAVMATRVVRPELSTIAINMVFMCVTLSAVIGGFAAGPLMAGVGFWGDGAGVGDPAVDRIRYDLGMER